MYICPVDGTLKDTITLSQSRTRSNRSIDKDTETCPNRLNMHEQVVHEKRQKQYSTLLLQE